MPEKIAADFDSCTQAKNELHAAWATAHKKHAPAIDQLEREE
jgi:hypothetical protein